VYLRGHLGTSWEKLFFSWEFLGTFTIENQIFTILFGNFLGKTFFFLGKTWEKIIKKSGLSTRKKNKK
jgi:hypothetical protein